MGERDVDRRVTEAVAAERSALCAWFADEFELSDASRLGLLRAVEAGDHLAGHTAPTATPEMWEASVCNFHGGGVWGAGVTCRAALDAAVVALRARGDTVLIPDGSTVEAVAYKNPVWSRVDGGDEAVTSSDDSMWFSITLWPDRHEVADLSTEEAPDADDEVSHA